MTTGHIQRRGSNSWRLKFDLGRDPATGRRSTRYVTFRGTKRDAQAELARLITQAHEGTFVDPSKLTVAQYLTSWIADAETISLGAKTAERYRGLINNQIVPYLGALCSRNFDRGISVHGMRACCREGVMTVCLSHPVRWVTLIVCCTKPYPMHFGEKS